MVVNRTLLKDASLIEFLELAAAAEVLPSSILKLCFLI